MTEYYTDKVSPKTQKHNPEPPQDELTQLRGLLLGHELQERLEHAKLRPEDVSQVLPEAVILRSIQKDEQLTQAMVPTVEEAIQASVKKDFNILADALFPVIAPASRKAVVTALATLTQSLNQTLDQSLSLQSFKWRLEARQTGKSFAEVVLLRTLLYRVEQVLLIHKKTGLLLQHLVADKAVTQDADLVSAMLTAIQDFVQDSFTVSKDETLETLRFGELTIWVEQGPQAVLAGVIRGNAPEELRLVFQKTVERIHRDFLNPLCSFQGDTAPFDKSRHYLEDCLQAQYKSSKQTPSPLLWILLSSMILGVGVWGFVSLQARQRWISYLTQLNSEPGIVVTKATESWGKYFVSGLRDPLAADPVALMKQAKIDDRQVTNQWEPYISLHPGFVAQRAKQILRSPQTVSLQVDNNGILHATGSAPRQWISEAQKLAPAIPGINQFQTNQLNPTELRELELSKEKIEKKILLFGNGNAQLEPGQEAAIQALVEEIKKIIDLAPLLSKDVHIEILGHTDNSGGREENANLSQARADTIIKTLVLKGIDKTDLSAVGVGTTKPLRNEVTQEDRQFNRSVSFKVNLHNLSTGEFIDKK